MKKILVINGPNLNMLGIREPEIYGKNNLAALYDMIKKKAEELLYVTGKYILESYNLWEE